MSSESIYCVYLTTYLGDKFPNKSQNIMPFLYLGSSTVKKVQNDYKGSVLSKRYKEIWKQELKNNIHLFNTQIISLHDTRSEALWKELQLQKMFNVVKNPEFINMAYANKNGCFGATGEMSWNYGLTKETSQSILQQSQKMKGQNKNTNPNIAAGILKNVETKKIRHQQNPNFYKKQSDTMKSQNYENSERVRKATNTRRNRIPIEVKEFIITQRNKGLVYKLIYLEILKIFPNIKISEATIQRIYRRNLNSNTLI